MQISQGYFSFN